MHDQARPGFIDLMASVGFLLLRWGMLEEVVRASIQRLASMESRPAIADFSLWAELQREARPYAEDQVRQIESALDPLRQLRNLIAHGMIGASADYEKHSEPTLRCVDRDDNLHFITLSEIQRAIRTLEGLCPRIEALGSAG